MNPRAHSCTRILVLVAAAVLSAWMTASATPASTNPLLEPWSGPYGGVPPFDRVRVEDFEPALEAGMLLQRREIAAIAADPAPASFENTLLALERSGAVLRRVRSIYDVWSTSLQTPEFHALEQRMAPRLAAFDDELLLSRAIFERIDTVYRSAAMKRLTREQQRLVWSYRTALLKEGAKLEPTARRRVAEINERLALLQTRFSQNELADEEQAALVITDAADLAGLSPDDIDAYAQEAARGGNPGRWVVANTRSAVEPFLTRSTRRGLREQAWRAWILRGDHEDAHDNKGIVAEILRLRAERSTLLGFPTFADWKLSDSMAHEPQAAMDLLLKVWRPAVAQLRSQLAQAQPSADADAAAAGGPRFEIAPWDLRYYLEKLRKAQYDFDAEQLAPYLDLDKVRQALFWASGRLYGLRFEAVAGLPVFHPDVKVWRVSGADGHFVGLWYFDPYARDGKESGAWMSVYRPQDRLLAANVHPIVSNNCNFTRARPGEPQLISWDDALTMFHEFGHALHGLLSDVNYPRLAGPSSVSDFGEAPAMVNESWLLTAPVLARLSDAGGKALPPSLVEKLRRARNFGVPFEQTEFLASALLDMRLHLEPGGAVPDPRAFEQQVLQQYGIPAAIVPRHRVPHFGHVFSGEWYAAGYYGYAWAEAIAKDLFGAFLEAGDPFDAATAASYLKRILSRGNAVDPAESFRQFRGRDPDVNAYLRAKGLGN